MKIAILCPKDEFSHDEQHKIADLGDVVYTKNRKEYSLSELKQLVKGAQILAPDPDNLGGFEKAFPRFTQLMDFLPKLKGIALSTTSYGWIDIKHCKIRGIPVCNIPGYSRESVAEHSLAMLLCLAKRIIEVDRKTQQKKYKLVMGTELKGKTLGIIGLGNIGSRMAELGRGIGMNVIAYNRTPKKQPGVEMKSLHEVLNESDALSLHVRDTGSSRHILNKQAFEDMKPGVMIVNTATREFVDEIAMAHALKKGKVFGYAYEAEDLINTPLSGLDNAIGIKGFGWYTKEACQNLMRIWTDNIIHLVQSLPQNVVSLDN